MTSPGEVKHSPPGRLPHFSGRDDAGGLEPLVAGIHLGGDVGSGGGGGADAGGAANAIEHLLPEAVDQVEVGAHALAHDLRRDVDHVGVAHVAAVDDVGHLHARVEFVGLDLDGEDRDLRGLHVGEDGGGHVDERARGQVFEDEGIPRAAALGQLRGQGSGNRLRGTVGDQRDLLRRLDAQAGGNGGERSRLEFRWDSRWKAGVGRSQSCVGIRVLAEDDDGHTVPCFKGTLSIHGIEMRKSA